MKEKLNKVQCANSDDYLTLYTAEDVQKIFALESISSARRLMNSPGFPVMRIGRSLRVTKGNLVNYIKQYSQAHIYY